MSSKRKASLLSTGTPASDDASISSTTATPSRSATKPKKAKTEKAEKPKAAPKIKTVSVGKEKDEKRVKEKGKLVVKEGKEEKKVIGKDGKEKVKAVTGDEAQVILLEYLKRENRPFSAGDVSGNLHGKVTKTLTDKLLKELCNTGHINGKGTNGDGKGSQWVYWALQDADSTMSPEDIAAIDEEIETLRGKIPELRSKVKELGAKLGALKNQMGIHELGYRMERLREEKAEKEERLKGLREGRIEVVRKEEVERVTRELAYWGKMRVERKKAFEAVEGMLLEGMGREEIWEKAGIEGDE